MIKYAMALITILTFSQAVFSGTAKIQACSDAIEEFKKEKEAEGPGNNQCNFPDPKFKGVWKAGSTWKNCKPSEDMPCFDKPELKMIECERDYDCVPLSGQIKSEDNSIELTDAAVIKELDAVFGMAGLPMNFLTCSKSESECICENRKELEEHARKGESLLQKYPSYSGKSIKYKANGGTSTIKFLTKSEVDAKLSKLRNCI